MTARPRTLLSLPSPLRLLVALIVLTAAIASGSTVAAAETAVAANHHETVAAVAVDTNIPAGHVGSNTVSFDDWTSGCCVAPNTTPSSVDDVIAETRSGTTRNITSRTTLSADEALEAGQRWIRPGYSEIGKPGSGVFLSSDELRRFRIDNGSLAGSHQPGVPHVHLELFAKPGDKRALVNNHIPFLDS